MEGAIQGRLEGKEQKATNTSILRLWRFQPKSTAKQAHRSDSHTGQRRVAKLQPNYLLIQIHYCVDTAQEQVPATSQRLSDNAEDFLVPCQLCIMARCYKLPTASDLEHTSYTGMLISMPCSAPLFIKVHGTSSTWVCAYSLENQENTCQQLTFQGEVSPP